MQSQLFLVDAQQVQDLEPTNSNDIPRTKPAKKGVFLYSLVRRETLDDATRTLCLALSPPTGKSRAKLSSCSLAKSQLTLRKRKRMPKKEIGVKWPRKDKC